MADITESLLDGRIPVERRPFCEATVICAWPDCDCDCDCFVPALEGAGQHSPGCRSVKRGEAERA
jgi:hypothetical protein